MTRTEVISYKHLFFSLELAKVRQPIELVTCGVKFFQYYDQSKVRAYGIHDYLCPKTKNFTIAGNFYSKYF